MSIRHAWPRLLVREGSRATGPGQLCERKYDWDKKWRSSKFSKVRHGAIEVIIWLYIEVRASYEQNRCDRISFRLTLPEWAKLKW